MGSDAREWLNLLVRWFHVVAGVTWIGQTYLFNWMEKTFTAPAEGAKGNISGELWMVHGGGFYLVEKQKVPQIMPRTLHWFKWESALTWLSGFLLLTIVYYTGGMMVEPDSKVGDAAAAGLSLAGLALGWLVYNILWSSPLGKKEPAGAAVSWVLIVAAAFGFGKVLSSRAAYIQIGAMLGTIMAANVWMRILPAQNNMLASVKAGRAPDMRLAARAKRCSKHNTYMSVPLIFLMLSSHFPAVSYGGPHPWAVLGILVLAGWGAAHWMRS